MQHFNRDRRGSAVQWFALAAALFCVASLAGAHALEWLSQPGRVSLVAYHAPPPAAARVADDRGIDMTPTGSIPSTAVMIRIR